MMARSIIIQRFRRIYSTLPPSERKLPIVKVDNKFLSWEEVYKEIIKKTVKGKKALNKLKKMGLL